MWFSKVPLAFGMEKLRARRENGSRFAQFNLGNSKDGGRNTSALRPLGGKNNMWVPGWGVSNGEPRRTPVVSELHNWSKTRSEGK